jgi:Flp pilus assembly pilin Flp
MERLVLTIITSIIMPIIVAVLILMAVQSVVGEIDNLFTANGGYYEKVYGNSDTRGILRDND